MRITLKFENPSSNIVLLLSLLLLMACHRQSPSHYLKNGWAKYQLGNYSGALDDFDRAIELKDNYKEAYYLRALSLVNLNRYDKAKGDFDKAIELDPFYKDAWFNRAFYIKQHAGDYQGAIADYNRFIELTPGGDHSFALNNRGFSKYKLGDFDGALEDIGLSISLNMGNSYAYRNRALVYISLNRLSDACLDLQTALDLGFSTSYGLEVQNLFDLHCVQEAEQPDSIEIINRKSAFQTDRSAN